MSRLEPFNRPLDRVLEGLRRVCGADAYRLVPGEGDDPDAWSAAVPCTRTRDTRSASSTVATMLNRRSGAASDAQPE
jgi:hypothetical protein